MVISYIRDLSHRAHYTLKTILLLSLYFHVFKPSLCTLVIVIFYNHFDLVMTGFVFCFFGVFFFFFACCVQLKARPD